MNNQAARGARSRPEGGVAMCDPGSSHGSVLLLRVINLLAVVIPILGLAAGIGLLWGVAFDWVYLAIMGVMYLISAAGITIGYHRLFTHRSFKCPKVIEAMFAALGSMAVEGPVLQWVATHRKHHHHSDREEDPHSPHTHGEGVGCASAGHVTSVTATSSPRVRSSWIVRSSVLISGCLDRSSSS